MPSWLLARASRSPTGEARHGRDELLDLSVSLAHLQAGSHAMADVIVEEAQADRLYGPGDRVELGEDVQAVAILLDHPVGLPDLRSIRRRRSWQLLLPHGVAAQWPITGPEVRPCAPRTTPGRSRPWRSAPRGWPSHPSAARNSAGTAEPPTRRGRRSSPRTPPSTASSRATRPIRCRHPSPTT